MNMFKKNGGFTLVELIVVIAILAILAAVTVPAYGSYINKAKDVQKLVDKRAETMASIANDYLATVPGLNADINAGVKGK